MVDDRGAGQPHRSIRYCLGMKELVISEFQQVLGPGSAPEKSRPVFQCRDVQRGQPVESERFNLASETK
jgi:hypothetical protein